MYISIIFCMHKLGMHVYTRVHEKFISFHLGDRL